MAFSDEERKKIKVSNLKNNDNSEFENCGGNSTEELDNIFRNSPYECDTNDKQWLGVRYYFWTDSEYFAQKWGGIR